MSALVVGSFVNGYYQTSFIAMPDYLATPEPQPMQLRLEPTGASAPTDSETETQTDGSPDEPHDKKHKNKKRTPCMKQKACRVFARQKDRKRPGLLFSSSR